MTLRKLCIACTFLFLYGCAAQPGKYTRPDRPVPATLPTGAAYKTYSSSTHTMQIAEIPWHDFIVEPRLQKLIELALAHNRDLRIATLNIERSRALYQIQRSDQLPKIDAAAAASFQRVPETLNSSGHAVTTQQYTIGLGVTSYELDLFGRVRSLKDQALEQFLATEHARRSIQISLISQVAVSYLALAADRERLQIAKDTLSSQQESYSLTKSRYDAGVSSALALNQARTTVDSANVEISRLTTLVAQDENALGLVVGSSIPSDLLPAALPTNRNALKSITPGLSSDALLSRPDILQAESLLKKYNANISAARAMLFPRITLVSSIGFGSDDLTSLFNAGAFAWKFAPQITLPIFDGGSNQANLDVAQLDRDIAVANYEKTIQNAFREAADALAQWGTIDGYMTAQQSLTDATSEGYSLSTARYENGVDSYLSVLDSQRSLYTARQNLISVRLLQLTNQVNLYKVLGGGGN